MCCSQLRKSTVSVILLLACLLASTNATPVPSVTPSPTPPPTTTTSVGPCDVDCYDGGCGIRCNGLVECSDYTDEFECPRDCASDEFQCAWLRWQCVPIYSLCNGYQDCLDGSDEIPEICPSTTTETPSPPTTTTPLIIGDSCEDLGGFTCATGQCIDSTKLCDRENDCGDWSDELSQPCVTSTPIPPTTTFPLIGDSCEMLGGFTCVNGDCVPPDSKCDGNYDCADWSDELNSECGPPSPPPTPVVETCEFSYPPQFTCGSGECIDRSLLCNSAVDCLDGSDEKGCPTPPPTPAPTTTAVKNKKSDEKHDESVKSRDDKSDKSEKQDKPDKPDKNVSPYKSDEKPVPIKKSKNLH